MKARYILFFAVVAAPLAIGGVHTASAVVGAILAIAALAVEARRRVRRGQRWHASMLGLALGLLAAASFVQVLPVPELLIRLLSPEAHAAFIEGWKTAFQTDPDASFRTLSLAPGVTADRALRWTSLAVFATLAANLFRRHSRWVVLCRVIVASGVLVLLGGAIPRLLGSDLVLGFYEPTVNRRLLSTFVNPNHASSFYGFVSLVGFSLAAARYKDSPTDTIVGAIAGVSFMIAMTILGSLGAFLAFWIGVFVLILGFLARAHYGTNVSDRIRKWTDRSLTALLVAATAGLATVVALGFQDRGLKWIRELDVYRDFAMKFPGRVELITSALKGSTDFWLLGTGAGSVDHVIGPYLDWSRFPAASVVFVENAPSEWLLTFGLPVGLAAIGLVLWAIWRAVSHTFATRFRSARMKAALAVGAYFFAVAQIHFPMFALGLGIPCVVFIVASASPTDRKSEDDDAKPWRDVLPGSPRLGYWIAGVATVMVAWAGVAHFVVYSDRLPQALEATELESDAMRSAVVALPTEPRIYGRASMLARDAGEPDRAFELAELAYELKPDQARTIFLARAAARAGRDEAVERTYRTLFSTDWHGLSPAAVPSLFLDVESAERRADLLESTSPRVRRKMYELSVRHEGAGNAAIFALANVERHPRDAGAHALLVDAYLRLGQVDLAQMWADQMLDGEDLSEFAEPVITLIRHLERSGEPDAALEWLQRALAAGLDAPELLGLVRGRLPSDPGDAEPHEVQLATRATETLCSSPVPEARRETCWYLRAWLAEQSGDLDQAEIIYERIHRRADSAGPLVAFLRRQFRCSQLEELARDVRRDDPGRAKRIQRAADACAGE